MNISTPVSGRLTLTCVMPCLSDYQNQNRKKNRIRTGVLKILYLKKDFDIDAVAVQIFI